MTKEVQDSGFVVGHRCDICGFVHDTIDRAEKCEMAHAQEDVAFEGAGANATLGASLDIAPEQKPLPTPQAAELLGRAARHLHDRASTYDKPEGERSMGRTVAAFNAITGRDLTESEGWLFMAVLKQARLFARSDYHSDSAEDGIAYLALLAEARGAGR